MEKKMNRIKNLIALSAFSLLILGLPAIASAQWRDRDRDDDYNRGGRNNGRYNQLDGVIRNLENRAKRFEDQMDHQDNDNGGYGRNNRRSDNLEELSDRFVNAAKRLDNEYDDRGDFNRSRDEAQRVLEIGSQISRTLSRSRGGDNYLYNEWNGIENDLRIIANAYGLNYDNGNNRNNRNNRGNGRNNGGGGGGWRNNFPFPF
jgi:hypothetical protein